MSLKAHLRRLADPLGGMVASGARYTFAADEPRVFVQSLRFRMPKHGTEKAHGREPTHATAGASGSGITPERSEMLAMAELLERHAGSCLDRRRVFRASARELGHSALDLSTLPACSAKELQLRQCYVSPPEPEKAIRWVEGVSLHTGKTCALPYGMVYLHAGWLDPEERLQAPISTGLAAHVSLAEAIVSGLLEVIERDALSIMWLQRIPGSPLACELPSWARQRTSLQYGFFDISTDLHVPVVCCVRRAPQSPRAHTLVSCAAGFRLDGLVAKTVRDIAAHSIGFRQERTVPSAVEDFTAVHHGATYMASKERAPAFAFLLEGRRELPETAPSVPPGMGEGSGGVQRQLAYLLGQLSAAGMEAFAVDLTTVEAYTAKMRVVRVIVPGLQPLPYRYATRYLAHPRLYEAPRRMGQPVRSESAINPWPHPFA